MHARPLVIALLVAAAPLAAQTTSAPAGGVVPQPVSTAPAPRADDDRPSSNDPRVCLEFPSREQVIACAERFRPRRASTKT